MYKHKWIPVRATDGTIVLLLLIVLYVFGCVLACLAADAIPGERADSLLALFEPYLSSPAQTEFDALRLLDTLWRAVRLPLAVFLLGYTALGAVGIPALVLADGFLGCYPLAALCRFCGAGVYPAAALLFCFSAPVRLPVLLFLSVRGLQMRRAAGDPKLTAGDARRSLPAVGLCLLCLLVCALLEYRLIPALLKTLAGALPAG